MTAFERVVKAFEDQGSTVTIRGGGRASASAPGHSASDKSVTITAIEGQVLVHSHSDPTEQVLDAVGLSYRDLFDADQIDYTYPDGRIKHRSGTEKKFRQSGNTQGHSLYRADRLDGADTVYVCEGEKDVHAAEALGAVACCTPSTSGVKNFDLTPLHGKNVVIVSDRDDKGRSHAQVLAKLLHAHADVVITEPKIGNDLADHVAAGYGLDELVPTQSGGRRLKVTRGIDVKPQRIRWLMPDWIPEGSLTLLAGREGLGKSTMAASLAAQITNGTLEGEMFGTPRNILYVHTEDAREFTVAPRLSAAGADMSRVLFVDVQTETTDAGTLILPLDTPALEKVIQDHEVALVVLDAATSSMSADLSGKDDRAVRQYLEPLSQLAARRNCVVLGLCHFGKRDGADTGKLILGSIAWSQVARSVLSVARDDDTGNLVCTNTKGNLAPRVRSMEAEIVSTSVQTDDGPTEVGVLHWLGESTRDARELLGGPDEAAPEDRTEAEMWLTDYLSEQGSTPAKTVKADARKDGISEPTIKRAAKSIGVVYTTGGFPRTSHWTLPTQSDHATNDGITREPTEPTEPTGADLHKRNEPTGRNSQSAHGSVNEPTGNNVVIPMRKPGVWIGSGKPVTHRINPSDAAVLEARSDTSDSTPDADRPVRPKCRDCGDWTHDGWCSSCWGHPKGKVPRPL